VAVVLPATAAAQGIGGSAEDESVRAHTARRPLTCTRFDVAELRGFSETWIEDVRSGEVF